MSSIKKTIKRSILSNPQVRSILISLFDPLFEEKLSRVESRLKDEIVQKLYERNIVSGQGERYDPIQTNLFYDDLCHIPRHEFAMNYVLKEDTVLDIACGVGYGTAMLGSVSQASFGVDISQVAIQYAKVMYSRSNTKFVVGDFFDNSITADVVVSFETLEHLNGQNFNDILLELASFSRRLVIGSVPYQELSGNNHFHVSFNLDERNFEVLSTLGDISFFYQTSEGEISLKKPSKKIQNLLFVFSHKPVKDSLS